MARPREFEEAEVLDRAVALFRQRGYDATSLADIEVATGLGRASLYAAFGDKEGLFVKALGRFSERYERHADVLAAAPTVREGFERLFALWFDDNCAADGPRGCLLQQAASTGGCGLPRVQTLLEEATAETEKVFRRAFERARASGEVSAHASPRLLARFVLVGLQGLSSASRAGLSRRELEPVAAMLIDRAFAA